MLLTRALVLWGINSLALIAPGVFVPVTVMAARRGL